MRLIVDASVLVGELLRSAGRERLADDRLQLFLPEQTWGEVQVELPRRIRAFAERRRLEEAVAADLVSAALTAIEANVDVVPQPVHKAVEEEARARSLRDPADWPLVASAIVLSGAIWTNDNDLLGTGVATWTTETLVAWLERSPTAR